MEIFDRIVRRATRPSPARSVEASATLAALVLLGLGPAACQALSGFRSSPAGDVGVRDVGVRDVGARDVGARDVGARDRALDVGDGPADTDAGVADAGDLADAPADTRDGPGTVEGGFPPDAPAADASICTPFAADTAFGDQGYLSLYHPDCQYDTKASDMAWVATDKLVIVGQRSTASEQRFGFALQLNDEVDPLFGTDGWASPVSFPMHFHAVVVDPAGRIVIAGRASGDAITLVALDLTGALDPSFGSSGTVAVNAQASSHAGRILDRQADGKLVVVGASGNDFVVARYDAAGAVDDSFGVGGEAVVSPTSGADQPHAVKALPSGEILVVGEGAGDVAIAKLDAQGNPVATFGGGGSVVVDLDGATDRAHAVDVLPDGRIVAVGCEGCKSTSPADSRWAVVALAADGQLDSGFAGQGKLVITPPYPGDYHSLRAVRAGADGEIWVAGNRTGSTPGRALLARLEPDGTFAPCFDFLGVDSWPAVATFGGGFWDSLSQNDTFQALLLHAGGALVALANINPSAFGKIGVMRLTPQ